MLNSKSIFKGNQIFKKLRILKKNPMRTLSLTNSLKKRIRRDFSIQQKGTGQKIRLKTIINSLKEMETYSNQKLPSKTREKSKREILKEMSQIWGIEILGQDMMGRSIFGKKLSGDWGLLIRCDGFGLELLEIDGKREEYIQMGLEKEFEELKGQYKINGGFSFEVISVSAMKNFIKDLRREKGVGQKDLGGKNKKNELVEFSSLEVRETLSGLDGFQKSLQVLKKLGSLGKKEQKKANKKKEEKTTSENGGDLENLKNIDFGENKIFRVNFESLDGEIDLKDVKFIKSRDSILLEFLPSNRKI